uniref:Uncharacterized protein n=1 Tax=Strongyloides papillosus TaxID=174720 RepID=A0A0N5BBZ2_STREA
MYLNNYFIFLVILCYFGVNGEVFGSQSLKRVKRDGKLSTRWISRKGGIDIPVTLTSLITCLSAGINEAFCLGPRVNIFEPRKLVATDKLGYFHGFRNGVDLRMLENAGIPGISEGNTEIGHRIGATVADRGTEFGVGQQIFNYYKDNLGGVIEADKNGVGLDLGYRGGAADDKVKIQATLFGITVGNPQGDIANPPLMPGSRYRAPTSYYFKSLPTVNGGGLVMTQPQTRNQWYRSQFYNYGDEYRTQKERACPWCFASRPIGK